MTTMLLMALLATCDCQDPGAIKKLNAKIAELQAENARLRGDVRVEKGGEGYAGIPWGSDKRAVRKKYRDVQDEDENLLFLPTESKVAGLTAAKGFCFTGGRLSRGITLFRDTYTNSNQYVANFLTLKELLTKKYGEPIQDRQAWSNDLYRGDLENIGTAVSMGHLGLVTIWQTEDSEIELSCIGNNFKIALKVLYTSRALKQAREAADNAEKLSDL